MTPSSMFMSQDVTSTDRYSGHDVSSSRYVAMTVSIWKVGLIGGHGFMDGICMLYRNRATRFASGSC